MPHQSHPLVERLQRVIDLTPAEREAIVAVPVHQEAVQADQVIVREGDRPTRSFMLEDGLACASKTTLSGSRQILTFYLPDDMPDLQSLVLPRLDFDLWAVADSTLLFIDHAPLRALGLAHPRILEQFWRTTLVDAAIHREWEVNLGQRQGLARMAHLFCEVMTRMEVAGRAQDNRCVLPVTHEDLADALGMTTVHVSRVLGELRSLQLASFWRGQLEIHDRAGLAELGEFDPDYLHLESRKAEARA